MSSRIVLPKLYFMDCLLTLLYESTLDWPEDPHMFTFHPLLPSPLLHTCFWSKYSTRDVTDWLCLLAPCCCRRASPYTIGLPLVLKISLLGGQAIANSPLAHFTMHSRCTCLSQHFSNLLVASTRMSGLSNSSMLFLYCKWFRMKFTRDWPTMATRSWNMLLNLVGLFMKWYVNL